MRLNGAGMRSLYVRIWLTVLASLALFAGVSGWLFQRHVSAERERVEWQNQTRIEALGELLYRSLPAADAPAEEQGRALRDWAQRLRLPMALDDAQGTRLAATEAYLRREQDAGPGQRNATSVNLPDGRTLWLVRPLAMRRPSMGEGPPEPRRPGGAAPRAPGMPSLPGVPDGLGIVALVAMLFLAVGAGAYPVVRKLTRRLEDLKRGVEAFGAGALHQRVNADGHDEVAAVAKSFNEAAGRVESLLRSNQSLLANASHELRSPLARLKMAVELLDEAQGPQRQRLQQEIHANIAELDALVEEVLLSSRLDATRDEPSREAVDLLSLTAQEAARVQTEVQCSLLDVKVLGQERLLRRAVRNLLENGRRYGGGELVVSLSQQDNRAELRICDRGPGVPEAYRERIFEAFFRLPGHAEREGGVGLGLALVRQIAQHHGGQVRCEPRQGGGACFVLTLPRVDAPPSASMR